jgi:flagellin-like hook-associated protein FlgL
MLRKTILTSALLSLAIAAGCDKAADDQQKATAAQNEANDKIVAARVEADKKVVAAQSEADQKISEAQASFMKRREDYRHKTTANLVELDHKVDVLAAKSKTATGKAQTDLEANLRQIRASRADFGTDYNTLETESASTWDATQARLDKEWTALTALVDKA